MALSAFNPIGDTPFHQDLYKDHRVKHQTNLLLAEQHCLMHNYKESDQTSPYLDAYFDISLCGTLALNKPHLHTKENSHTTYQVKLDVPIA